MQLNTGKKRIPKSGPSVQNGSTSRQQKWTKHSNKNDNCTINNRDFDYLLPQEQSLYHHQEWGMGLRFYIRVVLYEHVWILKFQVPNLAPATPCATSICSICRISKTDCMARFPRRHRRPFMFCRPIWRRRSWVYPTICNFKTKKQMFWTSFFDVFNIDNTLTLNIFFEASNMFLSKPPTWFTNEDIDIAQKMAWQWDSCTQVDAIRYRMVPNIES